MIPNWLAPFIPARIYKYFALRYFNKHTLVDYRDLFPDGSVE